MSGRNDPLSPRWEDPKELIGLARDFGYTPIVGAG
jgi:hypothetical protein